MPNSAKALRHPTNPITIATSGGVKAPPQRALSHMIPCARTFSRAGSQVVKAFVRLGKQPASPAPKRNCVVVMDARFHARPVAAVKNDHHSTMRSSTLRGPMRSPRYPPGISNRAYASPKAPKAQPICDWERPRSWRMNSAA